MLPNSMERVKELLRLAVSSHKSDGDRADSISSYNNPKNQADRDVVPCLLDVSVQIWTGKTTPLDGITCAEILRFLLKIDDISFEAAQNNIDYINAGTINGKMALYCISEIRLAIHDLSSHAITSRDPDAIEHAIEWIKSIGDIYVEPILGMKTYDLQSFTTSLELLPVVVETLHALRRAQPLHSEEHQQYLFSKGTDEEEEDYTEHETLLDSVFAAKWALPLLLPLSRIFCELYPYLSTAHLTSFQLKLTTENKKSEEAQSEDYSYAEVIRVALRLFEQSNDIRWVHVMRTLYRGVPTITYDSVQSLLEQIFTESVQVAKLLLSVLEDTAVQQGPNVTYQSIVFRQRIRNNMIENIPIIDESDVRLALVVARSVCNAGANRHAQAGGNMNHIDQISLPVMLHMNTNNSAVSVEAVYESQLCSRCVCMLLFACVTSNIRHFLNNKASHSNKEHTTSETTVVYTTMYDVLDRVINNTSTDRSSSGFHIAVRVAELVRAMLVLGTHPYIAEDCIEMVNGWFEHAYQSGTAASADDNSGTGNVGSVVKVEKNSSKPILPVLRIQLPSVHDLLLHGLCHVYKTVHKNIRPALLTCVLKGIIACATYATDSNRNTVDVNTSEAADVYGVTSSVASLVPSQRLHKSKHKFQDIAQLSVANPMQPLHELLQCLLHTLCNIATEYIVEAHATIQPHYATLLTCRLPSCIARVQNSLIHCCSTSPAIFGMLQSSLQKSIQSSDPQRQLETLRSLVCLLFSAPVDKQAQVVKTIQHSFSRHAVFSREIVLLLMHYLSAMRTSDVEEELSLDGDVNSSENKYDGQGLRSLSHDTLCKLQDIVKQKLEVCFVHDSNDDNRIMFDVAKCISGSSSSSNSGAVSTVSIVEDVGYLLQLHYQLDLLLHPEVTVKQLYSVLQGDLDSVSVSCHSVLCIDAVLKAVKAGFHALTPAPALGKGTPVNSKNNSSSESTSENRTATEAEAQLCKLLCAYSTIGSVIRCTLSSTDNSTHGDVWTGNDNNNHHCSNSNSNSSSASAYNRSGDNHHSVLSCYSVLLDLCAVQDVILQLAASFAHTKINSHESLESYYRSKLTGVEAVTRLVEGGTSSTGDESIAAALCVPIAALQQWLQYLLTVCAPEVLDITENTKSNSSKHFSSNSSSFGPVTLPTSTKYGIITYSAFLVRVATTQFTRIHTGQRDNTTNTSSAAATTSLLSTLLSLYTVVAATDKEDDIITQEETQCKVYRKYLKTIYHTYNPAKRRKAIRYGRSTRRKGNRNHRKNYNDNDSVGSGSDDGAIDSQSEVESEEDTQIVRKVGDVSPLATTATMNGNIATPMGFQLTAVLSDQQLRQVQKNKEMHLLQNVALQQENLARRSARDQPGPCYNVHFIVDRCSVANTKKAAAQLSETENSDGKGVPNMVPLPLMCGFLCHLDAHLRSEFSRWDMHIVRTIESNSYPKHHTVHPLSHESHYTVPAVASDPAALCVLGKEEAERLLSNYITPQAQYNALRDILFDERSELLLALTTIVPLISNPQALSTVSNADHLCLLMANELKQSMLTGLTLRVFNAYLGLLQSLCIHTCTQSATDNDSEGTTTLLTSPRDVSMVLWGALGEWRKEHKEIVSNIVQLALQFSELSGHTVDLDQCHMVLQSIAHQKFTPNLKNAADDAEGSGDDSENDAIGTRNCRTKPPHPREQTHEADAPSTAEKTNDDTAGTFNIPMILKKDTAVWEIVVTEETADQVVKEVLQYLHHAFSSVLKQQQALATSQTNATVAPDASFVMQSSLELFSSGGKVLNAIFGLFDDAEPAISNKFTPHSPTEQAKKSNKRIKTDRDEDTIYSANQATWLVDTLSGPRTANVLELLTKITTQAVRECNALLKAAQHFRRVCNFIVSTQRQAKESHAKRKERNTFSDSEEEEEEEYDEDGDHEKNKGYDSESSGASASSTPSSTVVVDPVQVQITKLSSVSTVVHGVTLCALLSAVPAKLVANYVAWLEAQPAIKRTQKATAQLDDLKRKLFAVLQQLEKIPPELCEPRDSLRKTISPRLWALLNHVHNPQLEFMLSLVNTKGQDLLECLQEPNAEEEEEAGDSGESETERDIRNFHRRTVHQGREKLHLRGAPHSSKISALTASKAARLAAAVAMQNHASKGRKGERRQSRNQVINMFMAEDGECGDDSFADLEDFLV